MKYYDHELYIRRKNTREQIDKRFKMIEDDFAVYNFEQFFNDLAVEVLNKCVENNDRAFSTYVYFISNGFHMKNKDIERYEVYLMTKKQIEKYLKGFDYVISKSYIERYSYRYYRLYGVFIRGVK